MTQASKVAQQSTAYNPKEVETRWSLHWFEKGHFDFKLDRSKPAYSIALPPPNITGNLHLGHALNGTLQDTLIRWKRMQGYNVHWQPGTDHAGISTQMVVERKLKKENKNRHQMGREKFLEACWQWRQQYGDTIYSQYKRLGVSFSWNRQVFTLDESYVKAIYRAFKILFDEGKIYRGKRVTSWCPRCQTGLSDLEVEHRETKGALYLIKYPLLDNGKEGKEGIVVATTRPESLFGDVAVAVNPKDERYQSFIGKTVRLPLTARNITVLADDYVDREFGTGALKITPAHDVNDWEIGQRHNLSQPVVIDLKGYLERNDYVPAQFQGLERFNARKIVVEQLQELGYLQETKDYEHSLACCERCGEILEPNLCDQWYVSMKELAQPAIEVVEAGKVQFIPERYAATYLDWMKNIRDWCISRQLWWGHRIPVWTCKDCSHVEAAETELFACSRCQSKNIEQDPDVLDTWFSSALWPFATLGWPDETEDMQHFYPTSLLSTAREIINLWVARMIFTGLKFAKNIPFQHVLIHPVVQTADGKRMSKSKGNAVDPLDMIEKYGADANRFWFTSLGVKGDQDVRFREDKIKEFGKFANKIWQAGKFVLMNIEDARLNEPVAGELTLADRWILSSYEKLLVEVNHGLANYDFDDVSRKIYDFTWDYFCDWYLEIAKRQLESEKQESRAGQTRNVLYFIYEGLMRLMHPVMPFITEELWHRLPRLQKFAELDSIMHAEYPHAEGQFKDEQAEADMEYLMRLIRSIRNIRHTYNVPHDAFAEVIVMSGNAQELSVLKTYNKYIEWSAHTLPVTVYEREPQLQTAATESIAQTKVYVPLQKLIDVSKTAAALTERKAKADKALVEKEQILHSEGFKAKAPPQRVELLEKEVKELAEQARCIQEQLAVLATL